jgi:hypothetical protein
MATMLIPALFAELTIPAKLEKHLADGFHGIILGCAISRNYYYDHNFGNI